MSKIPIVEHSNKFFILRHSKVWTNGFEVLTDCGEDCSAFVPAGFEVIGAPTDDYVSVTTDNTDMPQPVQEALVKLAYPLYRPQLWDQLSGMDNILRYDFKMYDSKGTEVSSSVGDVN